MTEKSYGTEETIINQSAPQEP